MRYSSRKIFKNKSRIYEKVFEDRGVKNIVQYPTPKLKHITPSQIQKLNRIGHVWTVGDRYYKLAYRHYGNTKYWWVLAWFNKRPTEAHVKLGDVIYIPLPLENILRFLEV